MARARLQAIAVDAAAGRVNDPMSCALLELRSAVWRPVLEPLVCDDPPITPLLSAAGVELLSQQRLLRARAGILHNEYIARTPRSPISCECGQFERGRPALEMVMHVVQCQFKTAGSLSGSTEQLQSMVMQALPGAAAQAALRMVVDQPSHGLALSKRMREVLQGPLFATFWRVLDAWLGTSVWTAEEVEGEM